MPSPSNDRGCRTHSYISRLLPSVSSPDSHSVYSCTGKVFWCFGDFILTCNLSGREAHRQHHRGQPGLRRNGSRIFQWISISVQTLERKKSPGSPKFLSPNRLEHTGRDARGKRPPRAIRDLERHVRQVFLPDREFFIDNLLVRIHLIIEIILVDQVFLPPYSQSGST